MKDHRLWPGKSHPLPDTSHDWHPATFHCLDVMACAIALMDDGYLRMQRVADTTNVEVSSLKRAFALLIGLHDIGKLSAKFASDIGHPLGSSEVVGQRSHLRHWQISYGLLKNERMDGQLANIIGVQRPQARWQLYAAVSGHHGHPPDLDDLSNFSDLAGLDAAVSFLSDIDSLLPATPTLELKKTSNAARMGWTLAGLTVVADWIGSNQHWFPYTKPSTNVADYWKQTQNQAKDAITKAGLRRKRLNQHTGLKSLFGISTPRPMQRCAEDVELCSGPMLAIIEDVTGSGKTESALVLAQRMMQAGKGEGIYVALPTMATANAMFDRLGKSYRKLFEADDQPSLALAHGHRLLNEKFRDAVAFTQHQESEVEAESDHLTTDYEQTVAAACNEWVADDKRKVFLADVGVGTIDQGFMSILPVKFSTLRLWGLGQRILIVDEAHACDPYMTVELERMLAMQAALGGSAIVMTATLTVELRRKLASSFRRGLSQTDAVALPSHYPSLTVMGANKTSCQTHSVASVEDSQRQVIVARTESEEELLEAIANAASQGCACVWIRNTVDQAIATAKILRDQGHRVELFHARFAMADRIDIEQRVLSLFGKESTNDTRRGQILIATQVVEQSLDLDFDWMASDLAPIDLLIQRAGRLWRHLDRRPATERPVSSRTLHVLSADPDNVENNQWARSVIGAGGWVYDTATLWRTARALFDTGAINSPEGLPELLERVAGNLAPDVPTSIEHEAIEAEGQRMAATAIGAGNVVVINNGYLELGTLSTEATYPTRLGQPTISLFLVKVSDDGELDPWIESHTGSQAASTVSLSRRKYEGIPELEKMQSDPRVVELKTLWFNWQKATIAVLIVQEDGQIASGVGYNTTTGLFFVDT